jgi:hypothetical protein
LPLLLAHPLALRVGEEGQVPPMLEELLAIEEKVISVLQIALDLMLRIANPKRPVVPACSYRPQAEPLLEKTASR